MEMTSNLPNMKTRAAFLSRPENKIVFQQILAERSHPPVTRSTIRWAPLGQGQSPTDPLPVASATGSSVPSGRPEADTLCLAHVCRPLGFARPLWSRWLTPADATGMGYAALWALRDRIGSCPSSTTTTRRWPSLSSGCSKVQSRNLNGLPPIYTSETEEAARIMEIDVEAIVKNAVGRIKEADEFDERYKEDAGNLIRASIFALLHDTRSSEVRELLSGSAGGFGCWLETVERVLREAVDDLPNERLAGEIVGSFLLAKHFLFDLEGHNAKHEKP